MWSRCSSPGNELGLSMMLTLVFSSWLAQISPAVVEFAEKHFGFKTNGKMNR